MNTPIRNSMRRIPADLIAVLLLIVLCWLFFWRLLTPNPINQQSLVEGDFSGQFVAFAHYQAVRFAQGEVPLWNPYNYGGHPFLADTQSAVFYPPRLLTIALLNVTGGSTPQRMYYALQNEMVLHTLIASLLMYAFVGRLTLGQQHSVIASLVSAVTFAYGGYLTAYPQLQLAVMEAGIWLPLALLGVHEATRRDRVGLRWFLLAGAALGLSFAAGHPQTALFFIYTTIAYLGWRVWSQRCSWRLFVVGTILFGLIGAGLAAVQLIPGWEYTRLTVRATMNVDAMGNGFPFIDVLQILFPGIISLWSPLYFGIAALMLAIYAIWKQVENAKFWAVLAILALALSFGHGTIIYDIFYNLVPGFNLFRGQERSAYVFAIAMSILAGLGIAALLRQDETAPRRYPVALWGIAVSTLIFCLTFFVNWLVTAGGSETILRFVSFSTLIAILASLLLTNTFIKWQTVQWRSWLILGLVILDLFSFGRTNPNLEAVPADTRLIESSLVKNIQQAIEDVYRIDGTRGLGENFGTLYGVMDIHGISPLRLQSVDRILKLPVSRQWEAFAVRYVPTENNELPVDSTIVAKQDEPTLTINLHQLDNPRPFARLVTKTWIEPDDNAALGIFSDPSFDARNTVILPSKPDLELPSESSQESTVQVTKFQPEFIELRTSSSASAMLSLSLVHYPGWQAALDGQPVPLHRADTAFTALVVPAGQHTVQLRFQPASYIIGGIISLVTLSLLALGALAEIAISRHRPNPASDR